MFSFGEDETPHEYGIRVLSVVQKIINEELNGRVVPSSTLGFALKLGSILEKGKDVLRATDGMGPEEAEKWIGEYEEFKRSFYT